MPQQAFEMATLPDTALERPPLDPKYQPRSMLSLKDYTIGIILLLLVVLLWTLSNFVTQDLYEGGYNKPFLVTYLNTSAFSLYLIPFVIGRFWYTTSTKSSDVGIAGDYQPLANGIEESGDEMAFDQSVTRDSPPHLPPLTDSQTAHLAFTFCLLWFVANWTVNASLEYTSVASATILTSMSGFFTLGIGRIFHVEKFSIMRMAALLTSFTGVLLVSLSDSTANQPVGPASHSAAHSSAVDVRTTLGDLLAIASALFYAMYVILLKVRIKSESRVNMQLFFGFVGLFNILACWPIGLILHVTSIERFELPTSKQALYAIFINMAITLSSDYLYVLAMLKTTPLVVTVGLSLTIPVAVAGDFLRGRSPHLQVIAGALLVLSSFIVVGLEDSNNEEIVRTTPQPGGRQD